MNDEKYIGLDVHQATISVAVMDSARKLVMESILETKAATILQFFAGLRGTLWVSFEEGTCAGLVVRSAPSACGPPGGRHDTEQASSMIRGLDVAENIRTSGAGRTMFLDIPFYRTH